MVSDNPNLEIPGPRSQKQDEIEQMIILAGFCHGLSVTRRFAFDGNERDALRRAGELLLRHAEKRK